MTQEWLNQLLQMQQQQFTSPASGKKTLDWNSYGQSNTGFNVSDSFNQKPSFSNQNISGEWKGGDPSKAVDAAAGAGTTKKGFMGGGSPWSMIGGAADSISGLMPKAEDPTVASADEAFNKISTGVMAINPVVGGLMKVGGFATDIMRKQGFEMRNPTNTMDKIGSSKLASLLPISMLNTATKHKIEGTSGAGETIDHGYKAEKEVKTSDVGGVTNWLSKKFRGKDLAQNQKNKVTRTDRNNAFKADNLNKNRRNLKSAGASMQDTASRNYNQLSNKRRTNVLAARAGTKLSALKTIKKQVKKNLLEKEKTNVIPSGALHARKHNLPDDIAKDVTNKGIPVISKNEKGKVIQHAEIEHSEIIFHKEVTDKLEALLKKGDDKAAIEAGKLLMVEILENTEDNANLIEKV